MPTIAGHGRLPGWPSDASLVRPLGLGASSSLYTFSDLTQAFQASELIPSHTFDFPHHQLQSQESSQFNAYLGTPPSFSSDAGFDDSFGSTHFGNSSLDTSLGSNFSMTSSFSAIQKPCVDLEDPFGVSTGVFDDGDCSGLLQAETNAIQSERPSGLQFSSLESSSTRFDDFAPFGTAKLGNSRTPIPSFEDRSLFDDDELEGSLTPESSLTRRRRSSFSPSKLDDMKSSGSTKREREQSRSRFDCTPQDRSAKRSRGSGSLLNLNTSVGVKPYGTEGNRVLDFPSTFSAYSTFDQERYN